METRSFSVRTVLSATTGWLLTESTPSDNGIGRLYELLGWMTKDTPYTHQLPRFCEECKPWLFRWFPELSRVEGRLPDLSAQLERGEIPEIAMQQFVDRAVAELSLHPTYEVPRIPEDDHERKDPFNELVVMRGTDEGVILVKGAALDCEIEDLLDEGD